MIETPTRQWCDGCQAEMPAIHVHGDPLEKLSREELLKLVRAFASQHGQQTLKSNASLLGIKINGHHR